MGLDSGPAWLEIPLAEFLGPTDPRGRPRLCSRVCSRVFLSVPGWGEVFGRLQLGFIFWDTRTIHARSVFWSTYNHSKTETFCYQYSRMTPDSTGGLDPQDLRMRCREVSGFERSAPRVLLGYPKKRKAPEEKTSPQDQKAPQAHNPITPP